MVDVGARVVHDHVDALFVEGPDELFSFGGVATINHDFSESGGDTLGLFDDVHSDRAGVGGAGRNKDAGDERWWDGSERYYVGVAAPGHEAGSPCGDLVRWRDDTQRFHRQAFQEGSPMRLSYHPDTDSLYIEFHPGPSAHTVEIVDGFNVDFDATGGIVGFDIDHASRHLDVATLEAEAPGILQRVSR